MDVREKLVEWLADLDCNAEYCKDCEFADDIDGCVRRQKEIIADRFIAHGVTVREWISVEDRLPELIPCNAGTAYSEAVNVCTDGRKVMVAVWDGIDWLCDMDYWEAWGETITHWTPVLLPLPQPPKGE